MVCFVKSDDALLYETYHFDKSGRWETRKCKIISDIGRLESHLGFLLYELVETRSQASSENKFVQPSAVLDR